MSFSDNFSKQMVGPTYELCTSLREHFDLKAFSYDMSFYGSKLAMLADQPHVLEPYYYGDIAPVCSNHLGRVLPNGIYKTNLLTERESVDFTSVFKSELGLSFLHHLPDYDEMVTFAFSMPQSEFDQFILNNTRKLQNFIFYFRNQMHKEIVHLKNEDNHFCFAHLDQVVSSPFRLLQSQASSSICLEDGRHVNISPQQAACLQILAQGKSVKEVAFELQLSIRTVENYLLAVRNKLSCSTLIMMCCKYGDQFQQL